MNSYQLKKLSAHRYRVYASVETYDVIFNQQRKTWLVKWPKGIADEVPTMDIAKQLISQRHQGE